MVQKSKKKILLATGGTGGHLFPALALSETLFERGHQPILFIDKRVSSLVEDFTIAEKHVIKVKYESSGNLFGKINNFISLGLSISDAKYKIKKIKPSAVIGFGGYASAAVMLAAIRLKLPTMIHEQNAVVGKVNRFLSKRVDRFCTTFKDTLMIPNAVSVYRTGMPVRDKFLDIRKKKYKPPGSTGKIRILVLGGSQGAAIFSDLIPAAMGLMCEKIRKRITVVQQCRPELINDTQKKYCSYGIEAEISPFFEDMPSLIGSSHLVLARAGSSTINEVAYVGRPGVFIPYPSATDNHQMFNASQFVDAGGGWLREQNKVCPRSISNLITRLISNPSSLLASASSAKDFTKFGCKDNLADLIDDIIHLKSKKNLHKRGAL